MSDLLVKVALDQSGIDAQLKKLLGKFKNVAKDLAAITVPVAALAGIGKAVDALAALGEEAIKSAGALYDQSRQLGVTAEALQEYRLVANAAGVSSEQFDKALSILNRTVGNSALGKGTFEKDLANVGIQLRDHEGHVKSVAIVYDELSAKVRDGSLSQAQSISLAAAAFGRDGGKMVEVLRQTAEQQKAVIDKAKQYGVILSDDLVKRMDEYGDELELVQKGTEALSIRTQSFLAPLALKWAKVKEEIAGTTAELARAAGLIDDDAALQARRMEQLEDRIRLTLRTKAATHDPVSADKDPYVIGLISDWQELHAQIEETKKASAAASAAMVPVADSSGVEVESDSDRKKRLAAMFPEYDLEAIRALHTEVMQSMPDLQKELNDVLLDQEIETGASRIEVMRSIQQELEAGAIRHEGILTQAAKDGAQQRLDFLQMTTGMQVKSVIDGLVSQTAGLAQYNKKMFEVNKIAAEAQAIVSTAQGVAKGVALGWPLGIPAVAWAAATGAAQISAIRSQTFSGGGKGTTPSAAGSSPVVNDTPTSGAGGSGNQRLTVEGIDPNSFFSGGAVRDLARRLLEFQRDGGEVVLR